MSPETRGWSQSGEELCGVSIFFSIEVGRNFTRPKSEMKRKARRRAAYRHGLLEPDCVFVLGANADGHVVKHTIKN